MGRRVRPRVRTSRGRRTSVVACVSLGDAAGPSDDRSGADVDLHRRAPDSDGDGLRVRNVRRDPTWSSERSSRTAAATRGSARTCGGIPPPAWASWCWATGRTSLRSRSAIRCCGHGSRGGCPDPSPGARARARGRARRGRASARGMGRRPGGGDVLDEHRHGRTARATPRGVRSSPGDARTVASLRDARDLGYPVARGVVARRSHRDAGACGWRSRWTPKPCRNCKRMELTSVPEPSQGLRAAAEALVSAANGESDRRAAARGQRPTAPPSSETASW